jgi:hypothetical protein
MGRAPYLAAGIGVSLAAAATALAAPAGRREVFELSAELEARVAAHQDLVNNAGRSAEDFCKLTADTVKILDPIVTELARFGGSEHQSIPFEAVERAYTRTQWLVPGLVLVAKEELTQTGIDYRGLAKMGPPEARPLLRAMGDFETGADGAESWGQRIAGDSACAAPDRGHAPLAALVKAWSGAPHCLRDALHERLAGELERMVGLTCFCAAREPALAAVRKNADLVKKLTDARGPELARRWLEGARAADARFSCRPD